MPVAEETRKKLRFFRRLDMAVARQESAGKMTDPQLARWQTQLAQAQADLARLGPMRPGSLSRQYRNPGARTGAYWQLSYTHRMRSRSRHVRPQEVAEVKPLLANFRRFRRLVERCVELSLAIAERQTELRRAAPVPTADQLAAPI